MLSILLLHVFVNKRYASAREFRSEFPALQSYEHRLNGLSLFQFVTHGYACMLAMKLMGTSTPDEVPLAFPESKQQQSVFLTKLATAIVDYIFISVDGVNRVIKLSGEQLTTQSDYCLCRGGNLWSICLCS